MLSVHEVTTAYQGLVAISAISIEVAKGEIVCVAGANGAGKSTLLKTIAGAERPRSGTVTFDGKRIDGKAQHMITANGIAYVPENRRLFPRLLMLDEPSQGIMPKLVDEIFAAVKRIRDAGMTVLIVEQRMAECLDIADRAYILQTGRVLMQGTASDIKGNPDVRKAYLGL